MVAGFDKVVFRELPPGHLLGAHAHAHAFDARALITAGAITLTVKQTDHTDVAGTSFELDAGCVHQERAGADGVTYLVGRCAR